MASAFRNIVDGVVTVLEANMSGFKAFAYPPDSINHFPCAVILPENIDPQICFAGNTMTIKLRVVVLLSSGDIETGFAGLYDKADPVGFGMFPYNFPIEWEYGIVRAIRENRSLNNTADDSGIVRIENIGKRELWGGYYYGFDAILEIIKTLS